MSVFFFQFGFVPGLPATKGAPEFWEKLNIKKIKECNINVVNCWAKKINNAVVALLWYIFVLLTLKKS